MVILEALNVAQAYGVVGEIPVSIYKRACKARTYTTRRAKAYSK